MGTTYDKLMERRINRILLICNNYDSFALEEDGRLEARIREEYASLSLSNPPEFTRVDTTMEAISLAESGETFDLVITMYNVGEMDVFTFSKKMKAIAPDTPIVLLTTYSRELARIIEAGDSRAIDYIFNWSSSTDLIIAIIKLLEDSLNAEQDILKSGVQAILLVEDSVRYYSTYLPLLYKLVLQQNIESLRDALNETEQALRKRARPKILFATNYADAVALYGKYRSNLLGVISDVGFVMHRGDKSSTEKLDAGIDLCKLIKKEDPKMPFLMQSSQESMREVADYLKVGFVVKRSKTLTQEVSEYIEREFGFGDFVVTDPATGSEISRASDLPALERLLKTIPDDALMMLKSKNYVSRWLLARGIFDVGNFIKNQDFVTADNLRESAIRLIHDFRVREGLGVVARFDKDSFNDAIRFSRLGDGSLGGKARGLAFLGHLLFKYNLYDKWEGARVLVPRTLVLTTDWFDRFILENGLKYVINSDLSDEEILSEFVASTLPQGLMDNLRVFVKYTKRPLAVRSSSKLEDSYFQPFAGVYSTYMVPHTDNMDRELRLLSKAIKSVYASVFFASSRSYITATANVISEEKMAIVLQEICGSEDSGYFFPTLSGVARSVNFYPVGYEKPEGGIVKLAYGLGRAVVEGEQVLRFSPDYPGNVIQTSTPSHIMSDTQQVMYALSLQPDRFRISVDDGINLERIPISDCGLFRSLKMVSSAFDMQDNRMSDSPFAEGPRFITFSSVLKYGTFPLPAILKELMAIARNEMKCEVEMEFAADLRRKTPVFHALQIRPISTESSSMDIDWSSMNEKSAFILSGNALGTGFIKDIRDVVYLKESAFDILKTGEMAREIADVNSGFRSRGENYVLIGYGRWGSSIPTLGVPVKWSDISEAKVLVEDCLEHFQVDPSQGTHFFQNLTSFNVGYVNVNPFARKGEKCDTAVLDSMPAVEETTYLRHVRLEKPLQICIDGRTSRGMVSLGV